MILEPSCFTIWGFTFFIILSCAFHRFKSYLNYQQDETEGGEYKARLNLYLDHKMHLKVAENKDGDAETVKPQIDAFQKIWKNQPK